MVYALWLYYQTIVSIYFVNKLYQNLLFMFDGERARADQGQECKMEFVANRPTEMCSKFNQIFSRIKAKLLQLTEKVSEQTEWTNKPHECRCDANAFHIII